MPKFFRSNLDRAFDRFLERAFILASTLLALAIALHFTN